MEFFRSVISRGTKFLGLGASPKSDEPETPWYIPPPGLSIGMEIDHWRLNLRYEIATHDKVKECTIEEMVWVKENDILGQESLLLRARNGYYLKIERWTGCNEILRIFFDKDTTGTLLGEYIKDITTDRKTLDKQVLKALKKILIREGKAKSVTRDYFSNPRSTATDVVRQLDASELQWYNSNNREFSSKTRNGAKFALFTFSFPQSDTPFTLRDLALIGTSVRESNPEYKWDDGNCYWFMKTMVSVIMALTETSQVPHEGSKWVGRPIYGSSSKPVEAFQPLNVDVLVEKVRREIREDDQKIDAIAERQRLADNMEKAEESAARALREMEKAQESTARAVREKEAEARIRQISEETEAVKARTIQIINIGVSAQIVQKI